MTTVWNRLRDMLEQAVNWRRFMITREGVSYVVLTLAIGGAAMLSQFNPLVLIFGMMCAPILLSGLSVWLTLRRIRPTRRGPAHAFAGDEFVVEIDLTNEKRLLAAMTVAVEDTLRPHVKGFQAQVFFSRVSPRQTQRRRYRALIHRRGRYHFGRLRVSTRFPFGLFQRSFRHESPGTLVVYPRLGRLTRRLTDMQEEFRAFQKGVRRQRSAQADEYHGLRDYRDGDSVRWVHWRTSARRGQLMVKEFERERSRDVAILLDPWVPDRATPEQREHVETAISFVATMAVEFSRRAAVRLLVGCAGKKPWVVQGSAHQRLLHQVLEHLGVQQAQRNGSLASLLSEVDHQSLHASTLIVVSTRPVAMDDTGKRLAGLESSVRRCVVLDVSNGDLEPLFALEK